MPWANACTPMKRSPATSGWPPGTVCNFRETLTGRSVRSSDPLLRIGDSGSGWEVELRLPQPEVGPILEAFEGDTRDLDVEMRLVSSPTRVFRGKLARDKVGREAVVDQNGEASAVRAFVRLDGADIPAEDRVPMALLLAGAEVHTRICCGRRPILHALFHDVWNFLHEKAFLN